MRLGHGPVSPRADASRALLMYVRVLHSTPQCSYGLVWHTSGYDTYKHGYDTVTVNPVYHCTVRVREIDAVSGCGEPAEHDDSEGSPGKQATRPMVVTTVDTDTTACRNDIRTSQYGVPLGRLVCRTGRQGTVIHMQRSRHPFSEEAAQPLQQPRDEADALDVRTRGTTQLGWCYILDTELFYRPQTVFYPSSLRVTHWGVCGPDFLHKGHTVSCLRGTSTLLLLLAVMPSAKQVPTITRDPSMCPWME